MASKKGANKRQEKNQDPYREVRRCIPRSGHAHKDKTKYDRKNKHLIIDADVSRAEKEFEDEAEYFQEDDFNDNFQNNWEDEYIQDMIQRDHDQILEDLEDDELLGETK